MTIEGNGEQPIKRKLFLHLQSQLILETLNQNSHQSLEDYEETFKITNTIHIFDFYALHLY